MDWSLLLTSFVTLFLAELGDKTQFAVMSLSTSSKKPWTVFLGASLALVFLTGLAAFFGEAVTRVVPEHVLRKLSAALVILIGGWMWFKG